MAGCIGCGTKRGVVGGLCSPCRVESDRLERARATQRARAATRLAKRVDLLQHKLAEAQQELRTLLAGGGPDA